MTSGAERIEVLRTAEIDIEGRMPWSSNATFLVHLAVDGEQVGSAIYKPLRGERPLWDFEPGLHKRERAAYLLSEHLGIDAVPPTVGCLASREAVRRAPRTPPLRPPAAIGHSADMRAPRGPRACCIKN